MAGFIGQIYLFPFNFAPTGFAKCEGQLIAIASNTALFSLLGTTYGGDGQTTFALPDLRGRVPLKFGQGPGLSDYFEGEVGGVEAVTLNVTELPNHSHTINPAALTATAKCSGLPSNQGTPVGNAPAADAGVRAPYSNAMADANMNSGAIVMGGALSAATTGGGGAHSNRQPYLALNYCIALQGIFPARN